MEGQQRTFDAQVTKVPFKVIDGREKDLHVKDELLGHSDRFQVLAAAHVSQHVRYACCTRLLECRKHTGTGVQFLETNYKTPLIYSRPNAINLLFHPYLLFLQRRMCLPPLFLRVSRFAQVRWHLDETCRSTGNDFDIPELPMERTDYQRRKRAVQLPSPRTLLII